MAINARKQRDEQLGALITAHNSFVRWVTGNLTSEPHADITSTTGGDYQAPTTSPLLIAATAIDLPSVIVSANEALLKVNIHFADAVAHKAADSTNGPITTPVASSQGTANTLLNAIKAAFNLHRSQAGVHFTNDAGNLIAAADATDLASSETLANAIKTAFNAHIQAAVTSPSINVVEA